MTFTRYFDDNSINELKAQPLFNQRLLPDIVGGSSGARVFPAIRDGVMDFYRRGGNLFKFRAKHGFSTHHKYASVLASTGPYVLERDLTSCVPLSSFADEFVYKRIKENCEVYAGDEARAVSYLYDRFSWAHAAPENNIVVLDIEISFANAEDEQPSADRTRTKTDRIDLVLFHKENKELRFVEAKLFTNRETRESREEEAPKVVDQLERYRNHLKTQPVLEQYNNYVATMNKIFGCNLPVPINIDREPRLYLFGFDRDQEQGKLKKTEAALRKHDVKFYVKGHPDDVKIDAMWNTLT